MRKTAKDSARYRTIEIMIKNGFSMDEKDLVFWFNYSVGSRVKEDIFKRLIKMPGIWEKVFNIMGFDRDPFIHPKETKNLKYRKTRKVVLGRIPKQPYRYPDGPRD